MKRLSSVQASSRVRWLAAAALALIAFGGSPVALASDATSSPAITGTVTDQSSPPNPLGSICVTVVPAGGGSAVARAMTSAVTGDYSIKAIAAGSYAVEFAPCTNPYYVTQYYDDEPTLGSADPVSVSAGTTQTGVDAAMELGGQITGTVTDISDAPLGDVCVDATFQGGGDDRSFHASIRGANDQTHFSTKTASTGHYTFDGLPGGPYAMTFTDCGKRGYLSQYSSADVVAGATANEDATMELPGAITGVVTSDASPPEPISGICVAALSGGGGVASARTNSEGAYSLSKLSPGTYQVEFTDCQKTLYLEQFYDGHTSSTSGNAVPVASRATVSGIDAAMEKSGTFAGRVTNTSKPAVGLSGICVEAQPVTVVSDPYLPPFEYADTNTKGTFSLKGLADWGYIVTFNMCFPINPSYQGATYRTNPMNAFPGVTFHLDNTKLAAT